MRPKASSQTNTKKPYPGNRKTIQRSFGKCVLFLWVHAHPSLYHRLSFNIAREVCLYICEQIVLLASYRSRIYRFSPTSKKCSEYFSLKKKSQRVENCTLMGEDKVFMCISPGDSSFKLLFQTYIQGAIQSVSENRTKYLCAIIYDKAKDCVYIFFTADRFEGLNCTASQVFTPSVRSFRWITYGRRSTGYIRCSWHLQVVYLYSTNMMETFDPRSETFAGFHALQYPLCSIAFVASSGGELVVVTTSSLWKLRNGQWVKTNNCKYEMSTPNETGIVWNGVAYYQYSNTRSDDIVEVDLSKGSQQTYKFKKK